MCSLVGLELYNYMFLQMKIYDFVLTETSVLNHIEFTQTQYIPNKLCQVPVRHPIL